VCGTQVFERQGKSIRSISAELGVSRDTVRKFCAMLRCREPSHAPALGSALDSYREYLQERVSQPHPQWISAAVLQREIEQRGYTGKASSGRAYVEWTEATAPFDMPVAAAVFS
jgi:transposase